MILELSWLAVLGGSWWILRRGDPEVPSGFRGPESGRRIRDAAVVLLLASAVRFSFLKSFPQGAYIDETACIRMTVEVLNKPFSLFTRTPFYGGMPDFLRVSDLYLRFNVLVVELFGVSYVSIKLLSAIPGVLACGAFALAARAVFPARVALAGSILFAVGHWPVRLSRHGWCVSFLVFCFALSTWLLLDAFRTGRRSRALLGGVAAGIALYAYDAGLFVVVSTVLFVALEALVERSRRKRELAVSALVGLFLAILPWFLDSSGILFLVGPRARQVSVFNFPDALQHLVENIRGHLLMFHWKGGVYARDNFPGLPMMEPVTGLLFLAGLGSLLARWRRLDPAGRLVLVALPVSLAGGIFSWTPGGAPYPYRVAPVMVPAFLAVGFGLESLRRYQERPGGLLPDSSILRRRGVETVALVLAVALNLGAYFGLEARNLSAMRVMGLRDRLVGLAIERAPGPVYVVEPGIFEGPPPPIDPRERYPEQNPTSWYPGSSPQSVLFYSGRYDPRFTQEENETRAGISYGSLDDWRPSPGQTIIFNAFRADVRAAVEKRFPSAGIETVQDSIDRDVIAVARIPS